MRTWLSGRSLMGAWIRVIAGALLPLLLTSIGVAIYQQMAVSTRVRADNREIVLFDKAVLDQYISGHRDLAARLAVANSSRSAAAIQAALDGEVENRTILLGMAWVPNEGEPITTQKLKPVWGQIQAELSAAPDQVRLLPLYEIGQTVILFKRTGAKGSHVNVLSLTQMVNNGAPSAPRKRWAAIIDDRGQELSLHDPKALLVENKELLRATEPLRSQAGWSAVAYANPAADYTRASQILWSAVLLLCAAIMVGVGLALRSVNALLYPVRRLQEVAKVHLPQGVGELPDQHQAAAVLVDRLEDRLASLEEEHQHFFATSQVPFAIVAWEGKVLEVNPAWCRLIGHPMEYFLDHKLSDTRHPDERFEVPKAFPELRHNPMTRFWTWHHLTAAGEELWVTWSVTSDPDRGRYYFVARDVTLERQKDRQLALQGTAQHLWLMAKSSEGVQAFLEVAMTAMPSLFPGAAFAVWEEPANGRWLLRCGTATVKPESASFSVEIRGDLARFGVLVADTPGALSSDEEYLLASIADMTSSTLKLEQESVRQTIQYGVNQLLVDAGTINDLLVRVLPVICRPMSGVAARLWAEDPQGPRVLAEWAEPKSALVGAEVFGLHTWMVQQTLADGRPRWIAEGTSLPNRPDEEMPVGRITFAVRVGTRVVGCVDCLIPVLRTPEAGFLTLLDSVGAQIGLYMERRRAEEERRRQGVLLEGRGDVLELIHHANAPLETVLERICLLVESLLPGLYATATFFSALPGRPVICMGPTFPRAVWKLVLEKVPMLILPEHRRYKPDYMGNRAELAAAYGTVGQAMVNMGIQSGWRWPVPTYEGMGVLMMGYYSTVEGRLRDHEEQILAEVSGLAQMAVERWRLEEAMDQRTALLLEHIQEGLVAVDAQAHLVEMNPAARKILHLEASQAVRNVAASLILPEPLGEALSRALAPDGEPFPATMKVDGDPVYAYVSPVRSDEGAPLGAIAILEDSGSRQRFQQLQTSLIANVSHDLKAPLAALSAIIEAVASQELQPQVLNQYRQSMRDEVGRLRRLTNDLLLLARLDAGLLTMEPEPLAMRDLLQGLAEAWAPRCQDRGLTISVVGEPAEAWADYDRVIQVLTNLLDNAIKFTPPGGTIQLGLRPSPAGLVEIFVSDTGSGIAPEHVEHLGSRFFMADPARQRTAATGTGLGLSIVRSLVHLMGGEMGVATALGEGTTFWVRLPAASIPGNLGPS